MANDNLKEYVLLGFSLLFYAVGSLNFILLFVIVILFTICTGRMMNKVKKPYMRKLLLLPGIAVPMITLIYFKYHGFMISTLFGSQDDSGVMQSVLIPLGISFFTFKIISYLCDIYRGNAVLHANPIHDALYLSIFTQIQSGPLTRYPDFQLLEQSNEPKFRFDNFSDGVFRFLIGFNKKILLADTLAKITAEVFATPVTDYSISYAWLGSICFSLQIYYDFSAYSDMAIGLTKMFGFKCAENFHFPYMTESVTKFWRRWHISLSQWFRDYVYIPLGGSRSKQKIRVYFNLLIVWILTGI
jgi:alginate O-acetyltransferase complex protein AlgI